MGYFTRTNMVALPNMEIIELSKENPFESFTAITWNELRENHYFQNTTKYINGVYEELDIKPIFVYNFHQDGFDKSLELKLINHIEEYMGRLTHIVYDINGEMGFEIISHCKDSSGFTSHLTITWENEDHRFIAINKTGFLFDIFYENKDKENLEKLREEVKLLKNQIINKCNRKIEKYKELLLKNSGFKIDIS